MRAGVDGGGGSRRRRKGFSLVMGAVCVKSIRLRRDVYHAGLAGLGALGIVSSVTLRTVPVWKMAFRTVTTHTIRDMLTEYPKYLARYERFEWYWTPYDDTSVVVVLRVPVPDTTAVTGCWPDEGKDKVGGSWASVLMVACEYAWTECVCGCVWREGVRRVWEGKHAAGLI